MNEIIATIDSDGSQLEQLNADKIVFVLQKRDMGAVLRIRNELALKKKMPIEVKTVDLSLKSFYNLLKKIDGKLYLNAKDETMNYLALSAAYLLGKEAAYFSEGKEITLPASKPVSSMVSTNELKLLQEIKNYGPIGVEELSRLNGFTKAQTEELCGSLAKLKLISLADKTKITELGDIIL